MDIEIVRKCEVRFMLRLILRDLKKYLKLVKFNGKWRKLNKHNRTVANTIFPIEKVKVNKYTYGKLNVHCYNRDEEELKIGCYCSIADNVHFFTGGNHDYKNIMSYPFKNVISKNKIQEATTKGPIIIEDDVWIGYGCIILSGVKIGKGAVIAAGSIVSKDIPPYAIYIGNEVVKYRFNKKIIDKLVNLNFENLSGEYIRNNLDDKFYVHLTEDNIDEIIKEVK